MSVRYRSRNGAVAGGVHQAIRLALNVVQAVDRRMPEAAAVASWVDTHRALLDIGEGPDFAGPKDSKPPPAPNWRRLRGCLSRRSRLCASESGSVAGAWVELLALRLGFDELEGRMLMLVLLYEIDERIERLVDTVSSVRGGPNRLQKDPTLLAMLLAEGCAPILDRLRPRARLLTTGLIRIDRDGDLKILDRLARLVRSVTLPGADPLGQLLGETLAPTLAWDAFSHLGKQAEIAAALLGSALAGREAGVNLLLYGPPGTGKTSFAATLAARAGAALRPVAEQDDGGHEPERWERLLGLQLAQRIAPGGDTVLLFDEAEDLFTRVRAGEDGPVTTSRVFIHRLLEQAPVPVIWTANDISALGPAVLRRMTMCMELKIPGIAVRTRLWRSLGQANGVALDAADAARLARLVPAAPAVAATALRATRLAGGDAGTARLIVEGIARAVAGGRSPAIGPAPVEGYDLALVQADVDLPALTDRLAAPGAPRAVSLLLSGPPGTGKSAYARHLASRMGLEVLHKRASDLLAPFVGETEANIAAAFAEAAETGAFLVFDEADSLLGDRAAARQGWEISQVNEMLTWMEEHPLPFACTTNLPDRLDPACLRRFLVKLRLSWLTVAQARLACRRFLGIAPPPALDQLRTLTPADFALVRRRAALQADGDTGRLLQLLAAECEGRVGSAAPLGFRLDQLPRPDHAAAATIFER